jgi:general secretion pathway protein H
MNHARQLRRRYPVRASRRGLTLVELLITIALVALLVGAVVVGPGMVSSARQRSAATLVLSGVRLGMTRANTTGHPVRMVFDLDENRVTLEQGSSTVFVRDRAGAGSGAEAASEIEKAAQAEAERIAKGPTAPRPRFEPVSEFALDEDEAGKGRSLGDGIDLKQVQTEHDEEPVTEGRAYLYFWPRGGTERAVIQIRRKDVDEGGVTVMVSALTGRAKIERGLVDLPEPRTDDEEFSEREEP